MFSNAMKVARWEIKRNLKNKTFIIGIFLTPAIIFLFTFISSMIGGTEEDTTHVYLHDQAGIYPVIQKAVEDYKLDWKVERTDMDAKKARAVLEKNDATAYMEINNQDIEQGRLSYYTSEDIEDYFATDLNVLEGPIKAVQLEKTGLSKKQLAEVAMPVQFKAESLSGENEQAAKAEEETDFMKRLIPGAFGGIILLSIMFSSMYIFQSASIEKKDKIAEILLSSISPSDLMQGKIIGYFVLGMLQAIVYGAAGISVALWKLDVDVIGYLLVPETLLYIGIAIMGYLLFAAIFVGIGATMADITSANTLQGLVTMLPFIPFIFIGPVLSDPEGVVAQVGSYIPFTAPGVLIMRLVSLEEWPWTEIAISFAVLAISIWISMKLAGKIFKIGIMMYGKNATLKEMWKWIRA